MKLILALGNPGATYKGTRHNAGFVVIDAYAKQRGVHFLSKGKFSADIAELTLNNEKILLIKPNTYYNETGVTARAVLDFYKLTNNDILVIHDDTNIDFGKIRVRYGGRNAGNNGLKSLHQHIGQDFWHIRIGINNPLRQHMHGKDFVLGRFSSSEQLHFKQWITPTVISVIDTYLYGTIQATSYQRP